MLLGRQQDRPNGFSEVGCCFRLADHVLFWKYSRLKTKEKVKGRITSRCVDGIVQRKFYQMEELRPIRCVIVGIFSKYLLYNSDLDFGLAICLLMARGSEIGLDLQLFAE